MKLNKKQKFVCEMIWGGVPVDTDWVLSSNLFKKSYEEFENGKWEEIYKNN